MATIGGIAMSAKAKLASNASLPAEVAFEPKWNLHKKILGCKEENHTFDLCATNTVKKFVPL